MPHRNDQAWRRFLPPYDDDLNGICLPPEHARGDILITGTGFIGSALARALAAARPSRLILLDSSEANLFELELQLESAAPHVPREIVVGSVEDARLLDSLIRRFRPEIVYHAAALKHVVLLERNPLAALRTNVLGTYTVADAALRGQVRRLVLISTDKAVNPSSIMGASKRLAERIVCSLSASACRMNALRLSNVIGSTGSVVPVFLRQIAAGKRLPVTHPEARRWFLSVRQAVESVLASSCIPDHARVLVPHVGEETRIFELAEFFVENAYGRNAAPGLTEFVGMRPGEKLREELVSAGEWPDPVPAGPLQVLTSRTLAFPDLDNLVAELRLHVGRQDVAGALSLVAQYVPEYSPSGLLQMAAIGK